MKKTDSTDEITLQETAAPGTGADSVSTSPAHGPDTDTDEADTDEGLDDAADAADDDDDDYGLCDRCLDKDEEIDYLRAECEDYYEDLRAYPEKVAALNKQKDDLACEITRLKLDAVRLECDYRVHEMEALAEVRRLGDKIRALSAVNSILADMVQRLTSSVSERGVM